MKKIKAIIIILILMLFALIGFLLLPLIIGTENFAKYETLNMILNHQTSTNIISIIIGVFLLAISILTFMEKLLNRSNKEPSKDNEEDNVLDEEQLDLLDGLSSCKKDLILNIILIILSVALFIYTWLNGGFVDFNLTTNFITGCSDIQLTFIIGSIILCLPTWWRFIKGSYKKMDTLDDYELVIEDKGSHYTAKIQKDPFSQFFMLLILFVIANVFAVIVFIIMSLVRFVRIIKRYSFNY